MPVRDLSSAVYTISAKPQQICPNMCHHPFSHKFHASTHEVSLSHYQILLHINDFAFLSLKLINFHLKPFIHAHISITESFPFSSAIFLLPQKHYGGWAPPISAQPTQISSSSISHLLSGPSSSQLHIIPILSLVCRRPKK